MAVNESSPSRFRLQQVWMESSTRDQVVPAGWVRAHAAAGAAAWTFGYLYIATAAVAVWAAWDATAALGRFFLLLGGLLISMALVALLARTPNEQRDHVAFRRYAWRTATLFTIFGALIGGLSLIDALAPNVTESLYAAAPFLKLHPNASAGAQVLLAPFAFALVLLAVRVRSPWLLLLAVPALLALVGVLILTGSRGAWVGLAAGAGLAGYITWRLHRRRGLLGRLLDVALLLAVLAAGALWFAVAFNPALDAQLGIAAVEGATGSAASRVQLWKDTLPLLRDYWFTGSGLAGTEMIYSTYSLLLHVPFRAHAHNFYLQVALEQGIVGAIALVGLLLATLLRVLAAWGAADRTQRLMLGAGMASVTALAVHGLFDAELYVSPLAPLIFLAVLSAQKTAVLAGRVQRTKGLLAAGYKRDYRWVGVLVALLLALLPLLRPNPTAVLAANLGAVAQSRAELGAYMLPAAGVQPPFMQDAVRRDQSALLAPAVALFESALAQDPNNSTAHRRLALIALAQDDQSAARDHLRAANAVQPADRLPRQLLGELAALINRPAEAVRLWRTVDLGQGQLLTRTYWYKGIGQEANLRKLQFSIGVLEKALIADQPPAEEAVDEQP